MPEVADLRRVEETVLERLMLAYQGGDLSAFDALHACLKPRLRRYLASLEPDPTRVDDLLQQTFLQIHRGRGTYRSPHPVVPWVFGIARYVFLTECRLRRRRGDRQQDALEERAADLESGREFEADMVTRDELHRVLQELSPAMREAVLMHHVCGLDFDEIADREQIAPAAARLRSSRGIAVLRRALTALRAGSAPPDRRGGRS